jgi:hypothetical protein
MSPKSITPLVGVAVVVLVIATNALALPAFTTAPKTSAPHGDAAELSNVAAACHSTFDRFVIRARFAVPGYNARYVPRIVADPSGRPVSLLGAKRIRVAFNLAAGHDSHGTNLLASTLTPRCPNLLQVKKAGDFEGVVSFGLGLSRMTGFRVFRLTNPTRVVIDVAH